MTAVAHKLYLQLDCSGELRPVFETILSFFFCLQIVLNIKSGSEVYVYLIKEISCWLVVFRKLQNKSFVLIMLKCIKV